MTIKEAIKVAKENGEWCVSPYEPTSVNVGFINNDGHEDETQFDLLENFEKELEDMWDELHRELEGKIDSVTYVEALGYIED